MKRQIVDLGQKRWEVNIKYFLEFLLSIDEDWSREDIRKGLKINVLELKYHYTEELLNILEKNHWNGGDFTIQPNINKLIQDINILLSKVNLKAPMTRAKQLRLATARRKARRASIKFNLQVFKPYLPNRAIALLEFLSDKFQSGPLIPVSIRDKAVLMVADISGFTMISSTYCEIGAKGLEIFAEITATYLGSLIRKVYSYGGDVIKVAGDALICIFHPEDETYEKLAENAKRALICASKLVEMEKKIDNTVLKIHVGISTGFISFGFIGGYRKKWEYLIGGTPLRIIERLIQSAGAKEICIDQETMELVHDLVETEEIELVLSEKWHTHSNVSSVNEFLYDENIDYGSINSSKRNFDHNIKEENKNELNIKNENKFINDITKEDEELLKKERDDLSTINSETKSIHGLYNRENIIYNTFDDAMNVVKSKVENNSIHSEKDNTLLSYGRDHNKIQIVLNNKSKRNRRRSWNSADKVEDYKFILKDNKLIVKKKKEKKKRPFIEIEKKTKKNENNKTTKNSRSTYIRRLSYDMLNAESDDDDDDDDDDSDSDFADKLSLFDSPDNLSIGESERLFQNKIENDETFNNINNDNIENNKNKNNKYLNAKYETFSSASTIGGEKDKYNKDKDINDKENILTKEFLNNYNKEMNNLMNSRTLYKKPSIASNQTEFKYTQMYKILNIKDYKCKRKARFTIGEVEIGIPYIDLFVPEPILRSSKVGKKITDGDVRYYVTTLFLKLDDFNVEMSENLTLLQPFLLVMQKVILKNEGFIRQFVIDDKGCVFIACWGVPTATHGDDACRAAASAIQIQNELKDINMGCSIGITTGTAFCMPIGSPSRHDYAIVGDVVNLAARLMGKADGHILIDDKTYMRLSQYQSFEKLSYEIYLKNKGNYTPYICIQKEYDIFLKSKIINSNNIIYGREDIINTLDNLVLNMDENDKPVYIVIEGRNGTGKTAIVENLKKKLDNIDDIDTYYCNIDNFRNKKKTFFAILYLFDQLFDLKINESNNIIRKQILKLLDLYWSENDKSTGFQAIIQAFHLKDIYFDENEQENTNLLQQQLSSESNIFQWNNEIFDNNFIDENESENNEFNIQNELELESSRIDDYKNQINQKYLYIQKNETPDPNELISKVNELLIEDNNNNNNNINNNNINNNNINNNNIENNKIENEIDDKNNNSISNESIKIKSGSRTPFKIYPPKNVVMDESGLITPNTIITTSSPKTSSTNSITHFYSNNNIQNNSNNNKKKDLPRNLLYDILVEILKNKLSENKSIVILEKLHHFDYDSFKLIAALMKNLKSNIYFILTLTPFEITLENIFNDLQQMIQLFEQIKKSPNTLHFELKNLEIVHIKNILRLVLNNSNTKKFEIDSLAKDVYLLTGGNPYWCWELSRFIKTLGTDKFSNQLNIKENNDKFITDNNNNNNKMENIKLFKRATSQVIINESMNSISTNLLQEGDTLSQLEMYILARFDLLPEDVKELARISSIIDIEISANILIKCVNNLFIKKITKLLKRLELECILISINNEQPYKYQFRHLIIKTAIYKTVPTAKRKEIHSSLGNYYENLIYENELENKKLYKYYLRIISHYNQTFENDTKILKYLIYSGLLAFQLTSYEAGLKLFKEAFDYIQTKNEIKKIIELLEKSIDHYQKYSEKTHNLGNKFSDMIISNTDVNTNILIINNRLNDLLIAAKELLELKKDIFIEGDIINWNYEYKENDILSFENDSIKSELNELNITFKQKSKILKKKLSNIFDLKKMKSLKKSSKSLLNVRNKNHSSRDSIRDNNSIRDSINSKKDFSDLNLKLDLSNQKNHDDNNEEIYEYDNDYDDDIKNLYNKNNNDFIIIKKKKKCLIS